ncbi:ead/Ea22-like family protein [Klebsiella pneumoniae]|uniref:ead/Ea22-like family protein n=1 Tax=Klebsiella pneumoniae TaxID=573 RepID=UPI0035A24360|nr:ead/Ea22-like family protein [Klebsiella pneumoniae]HCF8593140.1 ead/Ea22-like family protein [Klebsiella pneumoniae]
MTDITELAQRMKAAAEKATPGEWWADEVKNEGCYGSGDDCVEGFTSYAIYGADGKTLFDSLNSDVACISEEYDGEGHMAWDETAQRNAEFIALANPANILALVEALETEKRICATWRKTAESTSEKLEKAQAAERRWHRVASRVHEQACESDVKIDELEAIRAAAEKLVRCKGRYHSEQNYRALAALFGVTTPDLPPLDSESSAVTVKLTDINEFLAEVHDKTLNRAFRLLAEGVRAGDVAAMRAAGIKVEAE